jgi:gem associated protein 6
MSGHGVSDCKSAEWVSLVHTPVLVTSGKETFAGYVFTIDPVSESIVLMQLSDNPIAVSSLKVIFGHAIDRILPDKTTRPLNADEKEFLCTLFQPPKRKEPDGNLPQLREKLRKWLLDNKIPVTVSIDSDGAECLNISDALLIRPPYSVNDCQSANVIMLSKVQALLSSMPDDL